MAVRSELPALKVWLDAAVEIRAARVGTRDGDVAAAAREQMVLRQASEEQRYRQHHGIEIGDMSIYDLVIDTSVYQPTEVVRQIETRLKGDKR